MFSGLTGSSALGASLAGAKAFSLADLLLVSKYSWDAGEQKQDAAGRVMHLVNAKATLARVYDGLAARRK